MGRPAPSTLKLRKPEPTPVVPVGEGCPRGCGCRRNALRQRNHRRAPRKTLRKDRASAFPRGSPHGQCRHAARWSESATPKCRRAPRRIANPRHSNRPGTKGSAKRRNRNIQTRGVSTLQNSVACRSGSPQNSAAPRRSGRKQRSRCNRNHRHPLADRYCPCV
jgi:hypothetical protein